MMFRRKINNIIKRTDIKLEEKLLLIDNLFDKKIKENLKYENIIKYVFMILFSVLGTILILFFIFKETLFINELRTINYLKSKGFDKIEITGYDYKGCINNHNNYLYRTTFKAINNELHIKAEGIVCSPMKPETGKSIIDYKNIEKSNLTIKNYKKDN